MADSKQLTLRIGHEELVIRRRYELLSITNDFLMALWFVVGSVLFFKESTTYVATWFFLVGSVQFLIRPTIRLARHFHLQRMSSSTVDTSTDY